MDFDPGEDAPANFLNIGYSAPFERVDFTISGGNTVKGNMTVQYFDGTKWAQGISGIINTTVVDDALFGQSGYISFDPPVDWVAIDGHYDLRMYCFPEDPEPFTLEAVWITIVEPISDGLQRIMALAPPGWSLDPAGALATVDASGAAMDVYMQFSGESVLTALIRLGEQTANHFRLSASARRIEWLGATQSASGLRAIAASEISNDTMLIISISKESDTWEMYNRLYVYGGGCGRQRAFDACRLYREPRRAATRYRPAVATLKIIPPRHPTEKSIMSKPFRTS